VINLAPVWAMTIIAIGLLWSVRFGYRFLPKSRNKRISDKKIPQVLTNTGGV